MYGSEDDAAHGAEQPLRVQETAVHTFGIGHVGIFRLLGEGVVLQPRQQFEVHGHALVVHLRSMDVHVVHGRDEQLVAKIYDLGTSTCQLVRLGGHSGHFAVVYGNVAILENLEAALLFRKEDISLVNLSHRYDIFLLGVVFNSTAWYSNGCCHAVG